MSDDEKPKIFQLGTVPPPAGENDAYNAPTKVGPMAAQIQELINAATEEAERKQARLIGSAITTAPPPLATGTLPPPSSIPNDGRLPSFIPDEGDADEPGDSAFADETRIAEGAYAMLSDLQPSGSRASTKPPVRSTPPALPPSTPPVEAPLAALPVGPAPIVITEPLPVFGDLEPEPDAPTASESSPASYSDPIAHTRPEWSSVSKSEPKLPVAAAHAPNRTPLVVGILVVLFGIAGIAFLIYGHR